MTSLNVAKGILLAAQKKQAGLQSPTRERAWWSEGDIGSGVVIVAGIALAFSHARGHAWVRGAWQLLVIVYLGFMNGTLLSQASFIGWAQAGIPRNALGLVLLSVAALALPIFTKRNVYCAQLCPHGAVQQLTLRWFRPRWHPPTKLKYWLTLIPGGLLAWCLYVGITHAPFSLVDIEPFDAYVLRIAGGATLAIAILGIAASCVTPMAYCKYGCPTGALLEYVRRSPRSQAWTRLDWFAVSCVVVAVILYLV